MTQTKIIEDWPKLSANFRALIGVFSQTSGPSLPIWANPVQFRYSGTQCRAGAGARTVLDHRKVQAQLIPRLHTPRHRRRSHARRVQLGSNPVGRDLVKHPERYGKIHRVDPKFAS
jgi:hypothetical protein